MLASIKHGAIWQWLSEGFYVSQAKDPVIKTAATVLQPSNWLFPVWKTADFDQPGDGWAGDVGVLRDGRPRGRGGGGAAAWGDG
jgi:hypothetical protein